MRKMIIHIIPNLSRGGAETLLVGVINSLPQYDHRIISLQERNEFSDQLDESKISYLSFNGYSSLLGAVRQVRKLLQPYRRKALVHSHLFWGNIVSRFAVPMEIPLINSYHNVDYGPHGANYPLHALLLDRLSYQRRVETISVSGAVKENIRHYIGIRHKSQVLYNYISDAFFRNTHTQRPYQPGETLRLVAVGNLKHQKNYDLALEALNLLAQQGRDSICTLDVFGRGDMENALKEKAGKLGLSNIKFHGSVSDIAERLSCYDAYILPSKYEGFGLAVAEAMAAGLPVLVSDLPVLREVTGGHGLFFEPTDPAALAACIESVYEGKADLQQLTREGQKQAANFSKEKYMRRLDDIYQQSFRQIL